jgi:hypothetical protein
VKKVVLLSEKVGEYDVPQKEIIEDEEMNTDDSNSDSGNEIEAIKPTPTPPTSSIQKGDNPQLDLL